MKSKRTILLGLVVVGLETFIFRQWIHQNNADPSVSIAYVVIAPIIFGQNIITGLLIYFLKQRLVGNLFFINSIVAPIIFYILWTQWFEGWDERNFTEYSFTVDGRQFEILLSKTQDDYFSISDVTNRKGGSTTGLYYGEYQLKGDTVIMKNGGTRMFIVNHYCPTKIFKGRSF
jgi:hypothetical protein